MQHNSDVNLLRKTPRLLRIAEPPLDFGLDQGFIVDHIQHYLFAADVREEILSIDQRLVDLAQPVHTQPNRCVYGRIPKKAICLLVPVFLTGELASVDEDENVEVRSAALRRMGASIRIPRV